MDKLEKALQKARRQREVVSPRTGRDARGSITALPPSNLQISENQLDANRIIAYRAATPEADAFRILRTQVLQIMNHSNFKTLAITSPNYGDGKTTTSLNLAVSIALDLKQTVLLADMDLRKPGIQRFLGITPAHGLSDYLLQDAPLSQCLLRLPFERLTILPAGTKRDNSSEILGSPKMAALARELRSRYPDRLIIYDMPPILTQDDSVAFLPNVDAVLLVVRDGMSRTSDIKRCLATLQHANVIGTVLNTTD